MALASFVIGAGARLGDLQNRDTKLEKHEGNVSYVARDMGKARVQIHRWMQRLSIDVNDYRG
ncbi:MAG TPA: hypothetical protein PK156_29745 [Polyangium sp.]|nr:hypothetical protein [Polyangium sp.]